MKEKKYLWGSLFTGVVFCAVLAFNGILIPAALAATSEDSQVKTVAAAPVSSEARAEQSNLKGAIINNDAITADVITKDEACEEAIKALDKAHYVDNLGNPVDFAAMTATVGYLVGEAPASEPHWVVAFSKAERGDMLKSEYLEAMGEKMQLSKSQGFDMSEHEVSEDQKIPEDALLIDFDGKKYWFGDIEGIDEQGNKVVKMDDVMRHFIVDIDALSGECISSREFVLGDDSEEKLNSLLSEQFGVTADFVKPG